MAQATTTLPAPRLKRVLGLWDLIYYGIILISPIAAVPMFGEAQVLSRGHAVTTLLAAMVAMTATAVSFGDSPEKPHPSNRSSDGAPSSVLAD